MADNFYSQAILAKVPNYTLTRSGRPLVVRQTFDAYYLEWDCATHASSYAQLFMSICNLRIDGAIPVVENGYYSDTNNISTNYPYIPPLPCSHYPEPGDPNWGPDSYNVSGYGTCYYGPLSTDDIDNIIGTGSAYGGGGKATGVIQLRVRLSSLPHQITWETRSQPVPGINITPKFVGCVDNADPTKRLYKQLAKLDGYFDNGYYYQYSGLSLSMTVQ